MAELKIISMDEVAVEEVEWLWYPYIPYGKLTIIHGDGGEGKTTLILRLAALLSRGEKLPCDDTEREPIKVIYQTAEDGLGDMGTTTFATHQAKSKGAICQSADKR